MHKLSAWLLAGTLWLPLAVGCGDKTDNEDKTDKTNQIPGGGTPGGGNTPSGGSTSETGGETGSTEQSNPSDERQSLNNLAQIAIAMHLYHDVYIAVPPPASLDAEGKPLLSWRVHLLPFLEQDELYKQFKLDEPWDSEHNKSLIAKIPDVYKTPCRPALEEGATSYLVPTGTNTMFPPSRKRGTDSLTGGVSLAQVPDGTSNTLLVVEAARDKAVPWTKPDDLPFDPAKPREGLAGMRAGGFLGARGDASVQKFPAAIDDTNLGRLIIKDDGMVVTIP